ncbi:peptidylprolyl isomerase [Yinghuangia soli]|uniref:Peptidyl-prolyl cis-trans isomerase n=1 Tax=Yinghuangia soli TaxID=2908204 RepID=A0AA41Q054_9ACTN|nr:peptidylprolyl isomerase [Yinghuangia soli]MCF2529038.1 peptidylprolyl isomerase [Yinghuangia soli]
MVSKEQRQRHLARAKHERQAVRRAEARVKAKQRNALIGAVVAVLVVAGGGTWVATALDDDDKGKTTAASDELPITGNTKPRQCAEALPGQPENQTHPTEPAMSIDTKAAYEMVLKTTCGDITIALDAAKAPKTVNSFNFLAEKNYFDHTKCHRLTTGAMTVLQCGDPTGTGTGGPGYKFADENLEGATYPAGTVAMANSGPGTNGSQFFLVKTASALPPNYTPFGKITAGMDVLDKVVAGGTEDMSEDGAPHENVVLNDVTVTKKS